MLALVCAARDAFVLRLGATNMDTSLPPKRSTSCQAPNIAIMCMGSQGDCQPFIALALALQAQGARVRFYAPTEMEDICSAFFAPSGLPLVDFFGMPHLSVKKILDSDPAVRDAMNRGNFLTFMQGVSQPKYIDLTFSDADLVLDDLFNHFPADHIVYNTLFAAQGATAAEVLKVSSTLVSMQMTGSPSAHEPCLLISPQLFRKLPSFLRRAAWHAFSLLMVYSPSFRDEKWRVQKLGLRPLSTSQKMDIWLGNAPDCALIIARPPLLSPAPPDWPAAECKRVLGSFILSAQEQVKAWPPSVELCAFLDAADPPVYIGWGSMIANSPLHMITLAVRVLMVLGKRGVILSGWAKLSAHLLDESTAPDTNELRSYLANNIFIVESNAPHEWLFPRCAAIVHHGGAGTTASALRSGIPSVITPCFVDQPELAEKVHGLGVGIGLNQFHSVTAKELVSALGTVLTDQAMRSRAAILGEKLCAENGAVVAASDIMLRLNIISSKSFDGKQATCGGMLL